MVGEVQWLLAVILLLLVMRELMLVLVWVQLLMLQVLVLLLLLLLHLHLRLEFVHLGQYVLAVGDLCATPTEQQEKRAGARRGEETCGSPVWSAALQVCCAEELCLCLRWCDLLEAGHESLYAVYEAALLLVVQHVDQPLDDVVAELICAPHKGRTQHHKLQKHHQPLCSRPRG